MPELAVITPTFRPDAELFAELHRSVLRFTAPEVVHHVIVPDADEELFGRYRGARCRLWTYSELLPRHYLRVPRRNVWCNLSQVWPPVRGWVMQQALKIAVAGMLDADALLIADSDVVLVRPASLQNVLVDGRLATHRLAGAVHEGMPRHVTWHHAARRLLGLNPRSGPPEGPDLPDYVSSLNVWDPQLVRAMQRRIEHISGKSWLSAFTAELHVSEFIVYGVFDDARLSPAGPAPTLPAQFCHSYWTGPALNEDTARAFADKLPPEAVAMMISAKSHTPMDVRLAAMNRCTAQLNGA